MSDKPKGIPLSALITSRGFKRNYDIEFKKALDAELLSNAAKGIKHSDQQRAKAKQPRGKGDDGVTMSDRVAAQQKLHPEATPLELLVHVNSNADANGARPIKIKRLYSILQALRKPQESR